MKAACSHCANPVQFHRDTAIVKCLMCNTYMQVQHEIEDETPDDNRATVYFWLELMHPNGGP